MSEHRNVSDSPPPPPPPPRLATFLGLARLSTLVALRKKSVGRVCRKRGLRIDGDRKMGIQSPFFDPRFLIPAFQSPFSDPRFLYTSI